MERLYIDELGNGAVLIYRVQTVGNITFYSDRVFFNKDETQELFIKLGQYQLGIIEDDNND
jgi:hypothetical protein